MELTIVFRISKEYSKLFPKLNRRSSHKPFVRYLSVKVTKMCENIAEMFSAYLPYLPDFTSFADI